MFLGPYPPRSVVQVSILLGLSALLTGCGSSIVPFSNSESKTPATSAPAIVTQPTSLTVPIGLEAVLSVAVSGDGSMTAHWSRNGVEIPDSATTSYVTPAITASDTGASYTFTVSNSMGTATSQPAVLSVAARAPQNGDLRFQQVDSLATVNGYTPFQSGVIPGRGGAIFSMYSGTPIWMESNDCGANPEIPGVACPWEYSANSLPTGVAPLATAYFGDFYTNFQNDLATGEFPSTKFGGGPIVGSNNVITSLTISNVNNIFAISYNQNGTGGFDLAQHSISPESIQDAATQEGQAGRVITALAFDSGQLVYLSYGWTGNSTTVYETLTATATFATVPDVASSLAAQGYILTAMGGDDANGLVLVGTRVKGDTLPRPILVASGEQRTQIEQQIQQQGYAIVGMVETQGGNMDSLSEIAER
jgi:hypothetical protein